MLFVFFCISQQAEAIVVPDQWIYIIVTWKSDLGLFMYYNYQLKATDSSGTTITGTQVMEANPNFSIGRNVRGPSFYYAKFDISSFTTFNKFIPEADISNVYLFFWSSCKFTLLASTKYCRLTFHCLRIL